MALGFKIADGYVEVHADYDRGELRDAAQDAADDFGDSFGRDRAHRDAGRTAGQQFGDGVRSEVVRRRVGRTIARDLWRGFRDATGLFDFTRVGETMARRIGRGLNNKKIIGNAGSSFLRSFIEVITFGQADIGRARPSTAFAKWASRLGLGLGGFLATGLVLKAAEMIIALSPLLVSSLAAIPIIFLAKTDKQVKAHLKAWKKDAADFMRFVSKPIKIPFLKSLQEIRDGFDRLRVPAAAFFAAVGRGLPAIARGGMDFLVNFFKALKPVLPNVTMGLKLWGVELGKIGGAIGKAFAILMKDPELLRNSILGFSTLIQQLVVGGAKLVTFLGYVLGAWHNLWRVAAVGWQVVSKWLGLPPVLGRIAAAWAPVKQAILAAWAAFKSFATASNQEEALARFRTLIDRIKAIWTPLKTFLGEVWQMAWTKIKEIWNTYVVPWLTNTVQPWLEQRLRGLARTAFSALAAEAAAQLGNFIARIPGILAGLVGAITRPFVQAAQAAGRAARNLVDRVIAFFRALPGRAASAISGLWSRMAGAFTRAATNAGTQARNLVTRVASFLQALPGRAASAVSGLWGRMSGYFIRAVSGSVAQGRAMVSRFIAAITSLPSRAAAVARRVQGAVRGALAGAGGWLVSAGQNIIRGLAKGISSAMDWVVSAARNVAQAAVSAARSALGIGSPSKVFAEEVGVPSAQGIAVGLRKQFPAEMMDLRKAMPQIRMPEAAMAGAAAGGGGGAGFSPTVNLYMQPGFYSENAAAKRALTKDVFLALEQYRKDYVDR